MPYRVSSNVEAVKFLREAADVQRAHTLKKIGEYSIGHHTFNMLAMLRVLWPAAPKELIWAIVEHDVPERLTGDIPAPTKWFRAVDPHYLAELEIGILTGVVEYAHEPDLDHDLVKWLRGLDILELYLWTRDQLSLGNTNVNRMKIRIENYVKHNTSKFAPEVLDFFYLCMSSPWEMLADLGEENVVGE